MDKNTFHVEGYLRPHPSNPYRWSLVTPFAKKVYDYEEAIQLAKQLHQEMNVPTRVVMIQVMLTIGEVKNENENQSQ